MMVIFWNNPGLLLIEILGTNFSEISIGIQTFSFTKMDLNMSSAKWRPFCLSLNVLMIYMLFQKLRNEDTESINQTSTKLKENEPYKKKSGNVPTVAITVRLIFHSLYDISCWIDRKKHFFSAHKMFYQTWFCSVYRVEGKNNSR